MEKLMLLLVLVILPAVGCQTNGQNYSRLNDQEGLKGVSSGTGIDKPVTIKVLYEPVLNWIHYW